MYEWAARNVLFRIGGGDPEAAHEWTLRRLAALSGRPWALGALRRHYAVPVPREVFGIRFANPVGLAAGMDKNGVALPAWPSLGFGFVEVGTVTAKAQPGNDRPRMFRLTESAAVINRMGFNNAGAHALAARLARLGPLPVPLGISLGKSKVTPLESAVDDYVESLRALYPYGDYFAINVSSPNTPGLRSLQDRSQLGDLLRALRREAGNLAATSGATGSNSGTPVSAGTALSAGTVGGAGAATDRFATVAVSKPILVKIAPDLTNDAIAELLAVCQENEVAGVIATNTTLDRAGLAPVERGRGGEAGGLSGAPLTARAREVVGFVYKESGGNLPIIGVGGIVEPDDAVRLVDAGASLVQLYTGLVFHGPALVRRTALALR